jgi:hypothetical protein
MSLSKKYELPVYDPPATYSDFTGGINTSLSNEALQPNELRDGLNCHYSNNALINRPGASLVKRLQIPLTTDRYQGDFVFAAKLQNWFISVRNGHIFYGLFLDDSEEIDMSLLMIQIDHTENLDDCENYIVGLPTVVDTIDYTATHEGFIYKFKSGYSPEGETEENPVGEENEDEDLYVETLIIQNTRRVQGIPVTFKDENNNTEVCFLMATGTRILKIREVVDSESGQIYLHGEILKAYQPNAWEFKNIGVNNLSPFPNYYVKDVYGAPTTEIGQILTTPKEFAINSLPQTVQNDRGDIVTFTTVVSTQMGYDKSDFYYKWEFKIKRTNASTGTDESTDWFTMWYWKASLNSNTTYMGTSSSKGASTFRAPIRDIYTAAGLSDILENDTLMARCTLTDKFSKTYSLIDEQYHYELDETGDYVSEQADSIYSKSQISKHIYLDYEPTINDVDTNFYKIHSSIKLVADGLKALIYDSAPVYNSAEWFKTVISNYNYITYNGSLDFKTTKNEKIIGVVVFDTNIVVFSDNDQLGGNISVVTGNGDDYNDGQYYSPYKRVVANTNVSCDAYNTIQVADNYIIFKYRRDIYMLDTNDLSNTDSVKVITINDMVKQRLNNIEFPLERIREPRENEHLTYDFHELRQCLKPDEIFSEVTDGYYGLIFPNQGFFVDTLEIPTNIDKYYEGQIEKYKNSLIENVSIKPGLRWKCYFRDGHLYQGMPKQLYPWLRDVSHLFDIVSVLYIEGVSYFVRKNGDLITFNNSNGTSYISNDFKLRFKSKAYDMEAPALCKFLDNVCIYYNRDFTDISYIDVWVHNEAAYEIYGPENEAYITLISGEEDQVRYNERIKFDEALNLLENDLPIEKYEDHVYVDPIDKPVEILNAYAGTKNDEGEWINPVLNRPSYTSRTFVPRWRFPFLSAQFTLETRINQAFSLSALNFSYTSSDMPDFTRERLYRDIIRNNYK